MENTYEYPLVSVIMPCYNYGRYLSDALDSLIAQTFSNWECIVVDDGSKDNTAEVALQYTTQDRRVKYIFQENKGVAEARNQALKNAKGKYIQLLDADDMLEPKKLALQVELMEANANIELVYSNELRFENVDKERIFIPHIIYNAKRLSGKGEVLVDNLLFDNFFVPGTVLFRKELYKRVGPFANGMSGLEDWNYFYRAALLGFEFYNDTREGTCLLMRSHDTNASKFYKKMLYARIKAREHILNVMDELKKEKKLNLSPSFVDDTLARHKALLSRDKVIYNFRYNNFLSGLKAIFPHVYYSRKYSFAFYDGPNSRKYYSAFYEGIHSIKGKLTKKNLISLLSCLFAYFKNMFKFLK